ncbi:MAG: RnfABCDGE type electron transport complex subunit B [Oscillospiraceae bacterium]|nr:RnfABCDGE type electron transport complex subunit B [Oscillospiraceae bacterium]
MEIINAIWVLAAIGAVAAVLLVLAAKFMAVPVDEKFPKIRECLPGANCGACGYAGCDGYAAALASGEETVTNKCVPGADKVARQLAELTGGEFADVVEQVAVVRCSGSCDACKAKMSYEGITSCAAAKLYYGGASSCTFGCIGLGDCERACPEKAIGVINGLATVNPAMCIGCGICVRTCPNGVITLMADVDRALVACSNHEMGAVVRKECSKGCIGCKKCERECPVGAIKVTDNLAAIDYSICTSCGHCAEICTTGCITYMDRSGAHRAESKSA